MSYKLLFILLRFIRQKLFQFVKGKRIYSFITSKSQDFETYATVIERIAQGQHLTTEGFNQIVEFVLQRRNISNKNKII